MLMAEQHVVEQEARIEQQKQLIFSLESEGHVDLARDARKLLDEMIMLLGQMQDDLSQAQGRLIDRDVR
jgi:hypothetical protein